MKKKNASSVLYLISFFIVFLAFCAFAVDATIVYTTRGKLQNATEATALSTASIFNSKTLPAITEEQITKRAKLVFDKFKVYDLKYASIKDVQVNLAKRKVLVTTQNPAPTYFLSFLGVSTIELNAESCAVSEELNVTSSYSGINWITTKAAYTTDIMSKESNKKNLYDTAILTPLGNFVAASLEAVTDSNGEIVHIAKFNLIDKEDAQPLSLGPGGFITIKLPAPIIDKPGADLFIKEIGDSLEGYFVFVGLDNDPQITPYLSHDDQGSGISWKNISCSGVPEQTDSDNLVGAYNITTNIGNQNKFYGSGSFDIGASCISGTGGLSMAKYLRIVDDNNESAFVKNSIDKTDTKYYPVMMYGEASSPVAGADIDYVSVLNHVRLMHK